MKSVLISIQPYWVFLIIAKAMGWEIDKEKTIEVRKNFPKDKDWNKLVEIYCSKDKKSFNKIPKEYQPLMQKFLGKVIGEFVCDRVYDIPFTKPFLYYGKKMYHSDKHCKEMCLSWGELEDYLGNKDGYGWHISNLKIYDKPKELSEFKKVCSEQHCEYYYDLNCDKDTCILRTLKRPPQSWCYIESLGE